MCQSSKNYTVVSQVGLQIMASIRHHSSSPMEYDTDALYPNLFSTFSQTMLFRMLYSVIQTVDLDISPSGNRDFNFEYANDIALLSSDAQPIERALDHLAIEISRYPWRCVACSKCNVLLHDWQEPAFALTLFGDWLEQANSFNYLGDVEVEVTSRIAKVRVVFANL